MFKFTFNKYLIVALCGILILFLGNKYLVKSNELRAILATPIVTSPLTTGYEVERFVSDKGVTLGMPVYPEVLIVYEPKDDYTQRDVFDEVIGILEKDKWEKKELNAPNPEYYKASLPQNGFSIGAEVSTSSDRNTVVMTLKINPR